ncbi:hypothetical protein ABBQ32_004424 [Trebouxia sp. C0010 RCD-2024]
MAPKQKEGAYTAVVSGASGFIGTELVKQLLEKGYNVRGTVRSTSNTDKIQHLTKLAEALPGTLSLHEADLLQDGSFDSVVSDADYVFHTASPFFRDVTDAKKQLIRPAVEGTKNVLSSVAKHSSTIKRVVLTSSFASIVKPKAGPSSDAYSEEDWNTEVDENAEGADAYRYSKVAAEKAAWEASKKSGFELVTICPTFVLGPVISNRVDATSILDVKGIIEGTNDTLTPWVCDVRDIARAHILAAEIPSAKGRYLVSQDAVVPVKAMTDLLSKQFPQYKFAQGKDAEVKKVINNSKVQQELGLQIHPWQESIIDMATTLIQRGIAKPVSAQ